MSNSKQNIIIGNSIDININPHQCETEIRADVVVAQFTAVRLWGQVVNCSGEPVPNALIKLVKIVGHAPNQDYQGIAHTVSDCDGFYQFDICSDEEAWYKVLVGKSNTGKEVIVSSANPECPSHPTPSYAYSQQNSDQFSY